LRGSACAPSHGDAAAKKFLGARATRSPDGAKRNPGFHPRATKVPGYASLHPGYGFEFQTATASRSRRASRPSFALASRPLNSEGAGNAGRPMRPIAACAMVVVESTRVSQVTPESPGTPRAMVYGLYRALPGDRALLPPSLSGMTSANLTPASGCQDHTSSPSASAPFVKSASASTASRSNVRDDRETPLCVGRDGGSLRGDLGKSRSGIFLRGDLDDPNQLEIAHEFSVLAQQP
jgi:hypothetical protein